MNYMYSFWSIPRYYNVGLLWLTEFLPYHTPPVVIHLTDSQVSVWCIKRMYCNISCMIPSLKSGCKLHVHFVKRYVPLLQNTGVPTLWMLLVKLKYIHVQNVSKHWCTWCINNVDVKVFPLNGGGCWLKKKDRLLLFSVQIKHKICKNMNSVQ